MSSPSTHSDESSSGYESETETSESSYDFKVPSTNIGIFHQDEAFLYFNDEEECNDINDGEEEWPLEHPLPLPMWSHKRPQALQFANLDQYLMFLDKTSLYLQNSLESLCYDTVSNFLEFSTRYIALQNKHCSLNEFFRNYDPPIMKDRFNCVGIAFDLYSRLSQLKSFYPGLKESMYYISCEDDMPFVNHCIETPSPKTSLVDHIEICIKIKIAGRPGFILLDPGFHISQPITVMEDGMAPQSGAIIGSSSRLDVNRHYIFKYLKDTAIIAWYIYEKRNEKVTIKYSRIHPCKSFISCTNVVERRNLMWPLKSLLSRDRNGRLICGLHFAIKENTEASVTLFYQEENLTHHKKIPLWYFLEHNYSEKETEKAVKAVAEGTSYTFEELYDRLRVLAIVLNDENFVREFMALEEEIAFVQKGEPFSPTYILRNT